VQTRTLTVAALTGNRDMEQLSAWRGWLRQLIGVRALGGVLLLAVLAWWGVSLNQQRLWMGEHLWPIGPRFANDFKVVYTAASNWMEGRDPYARQGPGPLEFYAYPPPMLWFFSWCILFSARHAAVIWVIVLLGITMGAVHACWRMRQQLQCHEIPWAPAMAATLVATPVFFALERGQCDHLVLLLLLGAALALRGDQTWRQGLAGALVAVAAGLKLYPGLCLIGLLALRRWRAALAFVVVGFGLAASQWDFVLATRARLQEVSDWMYGPRDFVAISALRHSLSGSWYALVRGIPGLQELQHLPGLVGALAVLGPLLGWVSWRMWRSPCRAELSLVYLLWITALATFFPSVANDYNLIYLPLVLVAVWDRRDPAAIHMVMGLCLLWLQPFRLEIGPRVLFCAKLACVFVTGWCLVRRLRVLEASSRRAKDLQEWTGPRLDREPEDSQSFALPADRHVA